MNPPIPTDNDGIESALCCEHAELIECNCCEDGGCEGQFGCDCWRCGGSGEHVPDHCCACGGSPYCQCCSRCGSASVGKCDCPITVDGITVR